MNLFEIRVIFGILYGPQIWAIYGVFGYNSVWVQNMVPNMDPKYESQIWIPNMSPKYGSKYGFKIWAMCVCDF